MQPTHRLYIDEIGNSDLRASLNNPNHRYLSLTGVIAGLDYVASDLNPKVEDLKRRYFGSHPDDPIVLHRKDLVNRRGPFSALRDPARNALFDAELLQLLRDLEYAVITAVIDKQAHLNQYGTWAADPYHYCLEILMERFTLWLEEFDKQGDVMAESRGKQEDLRLKAEYTRIFRGGTPNISHARFVARLTSSQLKVKPKNANVSGLQLADLIAHPSFIATKAREQNQALPTNFGGSVAQILEATKYRRRSWDGRIKGYGRKWLPS
jgi:hypothetical protein